MQDVDNMNVLLDVVESLLLQHEAAAAKDVEEEVHTIVYGGLEGSPSTPSDTDTLEDSVRQSTPKQDPETGYVNLAYIEEDGQETVSCSKGANPSHRLLQQLLLLVEGRQGQRVPSANTSVCRSGNGLVSSQGVVLDRRECVLCSTSHHPRQPRSNNKRHSYSVPGRIRTKTGKITPDLRSLFVTPDTTHTCLHQTHATDNSQNKPLPSSAASSKQNTNHNKPSEDSLQDINDRQNKTKVNQDRALKLLTHKSHHEDHSRQDLHDPHTNSTREVENGAMEHKMEYTKL